MSQCTNCGKANAFLQVAGTNVPLCLDCYVKFQSVQLQQAELEYRMLYIAKSELDDMCEAVGMQITRMPPPSRPQVTTAMNVALNNINVSDSQIATLNTGSISDVDASVTVLRGEGKDDLAQQINQLTEAIIKSTDFNQAAKNEILELMASLSVEATAPAERQRKSVVRSVMQRLSDLLSDASTASVLWDKLRILLTGLFGI